MRLLINSFFNLFGQVVAFRIGFILPIPFFTLSAMKFFLGELQLGSFVELLEQFDIPYDDSLVSGAMVEVTFVK